MKRLCPLFFFSAQVCKDEKQSKRWLESIVGTVQKQFVPVQVGSLCLCPLLVVGRGGIGGSLLASGGLLLGLAAG